MNESIKPDFNTFFRIICRNELGDDLSLVLKFSDADGERTGNSGYSFGYSQFDITKNKTGIQCLKECGFSNEAIYDLQTQNAPPVVMKIFEKQLADHAEIVDRYDRLHLSECLDHVRNTCEAGKIALMDVQTFYHLADYHNQLHFTNRGKMYLYLQELEREISPYDIFHFKLHYTLWGIKRPDDVQRRFTNIADICEGRA